MHLIADDLYELVGYVGDDEAQYVCKLCLTRANKPRLGRPEWLIALEKLRIKGFSIICTSILNKKYAQPVAKVDEEELKAFYDRHGEGELNYCVRCKGSYLDYNHQYKGGYLDHNKQYKGGYLDYNRQYKGGYLDCDYKYKGGYLDYYYQYKGG